MKKTILFTLNQIEELQKNEIINWEQYFKNNNPIIVEIGCGNGHFLVNEALLNKNINYIGIDIKKDRIEKCHKKQKSNKLQNIVWINGEAFSSLSLLFSDNSIHKIYMTFPDPWPKRRDHKKRLFNKNFLDLILKKLNKDSEFFFITDFEDYYNWCIRIINENCIKYFQYCNEELSKFNQSLFAKKWEKRE